MKSRQYWENRQAQRMFEYMELSEDAAKEISKYYRNSSLYINNKLDEIFTRYQNKFDLGEEEARNLLNMLDDPTSIDDLIKKLKSNLTTEERKNLLAMLEAPAYRTRLNRLQELQKEIDKLMENVYKQEKEISTRNYINVAKESYNKSMFDVQQQTYGFPFSTLDKSDFNRVLGSKWSGANFSERIWANTQEVAKTLKEELIVSLMTGRKESDVAKIITNRFAVGNNQARRLVRTESCFVVGEMQAQAYDDAGIEKYRFVATLDMDTSKQCRALDGKVFELSKREIGKNYPPIHPWCRSTTICNIDEEALSKIERIARDPETGETYKVPANMTYDEWYKKYAEEEPISLTKDEEYAIKTYISSKSYVINDNLRRGLELSNEDKKLVKDLNSALDKMPIYKGTVVRDLDFMPYDVNDFIKGHKVGNVVRYPAFTSSTKNNTYSDDPNVRLIIKSKTGRDISNYNEGEAEILFKTNCSFSILKQEEKDGIIILYMNEE